MKTFVPLNLGFPHISWNEILADHQIVIDNKLDIAITNRETATVMVFLSNIQIKID